MTDIQKLAALMRGLHDRITKLEQQMIEQQHKNGILTDQVASLQEQISELSSPKDESEFGGGLS